MVFDNINSLNQTTFGYIFQQLGLERFSHMAVRSSLLAARLPFQSSIASIFAESRSAKSKLVMTIFLFPVKIS
jgi:hypothetical protein